jgi:hypothetical protein
LYTTEEKRSEKMKTWIDDDDDDDDDDKYLEFQGVSKSFRTES